MKILLAPLIDRQDVGENVYCRDGKERVMVPIMACYIADKKETSRATLIKSKSRCSCHRCLLETSLFSTFSKGKDRTKKAMKRLYRSQDVKKLKKLSVDNMENAFWKLRYFDYHNFGTDKLHSSEQVHLLCFILRWRAVRRINFPFP